MAVKKQKSSKERKQSQPVSRSYTTTKGDKVSVLKNGTKIVNGVETGKVPVKEGYRQVQGNSGSSRLVKIGSGADAKYDSTGYYTKAKYENPFTKRIQTTNAQRTTDLRTQTRFNEVMQGRATGMTTPTSPTGTPLTTPDSQSTRTGTGAPVATDIQGQGSVGASSVPNNQSTVVNSVQNSDGTFTNTMSDGTTQMESAIQSAERKNTEQNNKQLSDLERQKIQFDTKIDRLLKSNNSLYNSTINSIKNTFASRKDALGESYSRLEDSRAKAGYQTDAFRYTPTHAEGLVTNDENNYINDLADLDAQEEGLILQAIQAKDAKDWDALEAQMEMYSNINQQKTAIYGQLLTAAQAQNRRIEDEAAIDREIAEKAAQTKKGDPAIKLAMSVAPVISKAIAKMSDEEAVAYVIKKAEELGIDSDILRSQVIDRSREDADYARSLIPKAQKGEKLTEEDIFAGIDTILSNPNSAMFPQSDNQSMMPVPFRDPSGFLTVDGYKTLVSQARSNGVSREKFLSNYGGELDPNNLAAYGLSAKDQENLGY